MNYFIEGWKAQTEYAAEYSHNGSRWALNFFAIDNEDAKKKLDSLKASVQLLGPIEERICIDES